jgi:hypothetical protein
MRAEVALLKAVAAIRAIGPGELHPASATMMTDVVMSLVQFLANKPVRPPRRRREDVGPARRNRIVSEELDPGAGHDERG